MILFRSVSGVVFSSRLSLKLSAPFWTSILTEVTSTSSLQKLLVMWTVISLSILRSIGTRSRVIFRIEFDPELAEIVLLKLQIHNRKLLFMTFKDLGFP